MNTKKGCCECEGVSFAGERITYAFCPVHSPYKSHTDSTKKCEHVLDSELLNPSCWDCGQEIPYNKPVSQDKESSEEESVAETVSLKKVREQAKKEERSRITSLIEKKRISHMDDEEYPHDDCTAVTRHNAIIDEILGEIQ